MYARIQHMKRTTFFIEEALDHDLHSLASLRGVPVSELVREALGRYVAEQGRKKEFKLAFLAAGRSGHRNFAERHEDLLWRDLDPHEVRARPKRERKR